MNSFVARSVVSSSAIALIAGAVLFGHVRREQIEMGSGAARPLGGLLVSNTREPEVGESEYFYELTKLLKSEYVDPVTDDDKLASGAVRGMINSLADPACQFFNAAQFKQYLANQQGKFEGIGIQLKLQYDEDQVKRLHKVTKVPEDPKQMPDPALLVPKLVVVAVAEGGPAEKAGIKAGDRIQSIDNRVVLSSDAILEIREMQKKAMSGKLPPKEVDSLRKEMQERVKTSLTSGRARDLLTEGVTGSLLVKWQRGKDASQAMVRKMALDQSALAHSANGAIVLHFGKGSEEALRSSLAKSKNPTIDLRNNALGDYEVMKRCLALMLPKGDYGEIGFERTSAKKAFVVNGGKLKRSVTLIVDRSTADAAEVFAKVLQQAGGAKLVGGPTSGDGTITETFALPDGSGYTLPIGKYYGTGRTN